jgi:class 3 adenylate cyclase
VRPEKRGALHAKAWAEVPVCRRKPSQAAQRSHGRRHLPFHLCPTALELVDDVASAGLPPAHVGLRAGPVLFQQGDYYGRTVNLASRIAEYARPGEVLVTQEVVDAPAEVDVTFTEIGPVKLKGISGVRLHAAHRAEAR